MKALPLLLFSVLSALPPVWCHFAQADDLTHYVDPLIGTDESPVFNPKKSGHGGTGNVYPGAVLPFGMVQFGPDTDHSGRLGYSYPDTKIRGFSLTHLSGAGCIVSHELLGFPLIKPGGLADSSVPFSHAQESISPGYYGVKLGNGVKVEMTATARTGFARMQFPAQSATAPMPLPIPMTVSIQAPTTSALPQPGGLRVIDANKVGGWVQGGNFCDLGNKFVVFYAIEFDAPIIHSTIASDGVTLQFDSSKQQPLQIKAAISYVSEKNAWLNLSTENPDWVFSELKNAAKSQWNLALGKIALPGISLNGAGDNTANDKKIFYTALYHSLLHPNVFSDVNGDYMGFDRAPHAASPPTRVQYANFSGWDVYRTQIQLIAILFPDRASDMMQSLINDAAQCGGLPRWPYNNDEAAIMVGDPGAVLLANAYAFGAQNFDLAEALELMKKGGTDPTTACNGHQTRPGLAEYLKSGFVPEGDSGVWGSASTTLEYNVADFAIARFAHALGDTKAENEFRARSATWKNLYDAQTGYIRPKDKTGAWLTGFNPSSGTGFVEGNAAQYTWMVPFDFSALITELGGAAATNQRLDGFFSQLNAGENFPYFWLGDEPGFATPWLYNWTKAPSHAADVIQRSLKEMFSAGPGGLPGNDDLGAMSAWYVWAALGVYPVAPGVGGFSVNPPLFTQAEIHFDNGHVTRISVERSALSSHYIQTLAVDGVAVAQPWVSWSKIQKSKELKFNLSNQVSIWATR